MSLIEQSEGNIGGKFIQFPGPVITWVGEMPWINGFAYGDEEGGLRFTTIDGHPAGRFKVIESERSINRVAFSEANGFRYIAACTANDIAVHRVTEEGELRVLKVYDWGGHGIYAMQHGGFLVPAGPVGLRVLTPRPDGSVDEAVYNDSRNAKYFYSMARIAFPQLGTEVWACAGRSDGLMVITLKGGRVQGQPRSMQSTIKPKDYVAACSIGRTEMPFATVSLSRDGEVDFFENVRTEKPPLTWHFNHPQSIGVAYSIATIDGHLFILTSTGIYTCVDIVDRFIRGKLRVGVEVVTVRHMPLEIIDFAVAYKTWMMVLIHDKIIRFHLNDLLATGQSMTGHSVGQVPATEASDSESVWADISLPSAVAHLAVA